MLVVRAGVVEAPGMAAPVGSGLRLEVRSGWTHPSEARLDLFAEQLEAGQAEPALPELELVGFLKRDSYSSAHLCFLDCLADWCHG